MLWITDNRGHRVDHGQRRLQDRKWLDGKTMAAAVACGKCWPSRSAFLLSLLLLASSNTTKTHNLCCFVSSSLDKDQKKTNTPFSRKLTCVFSIYWLFEVIDERQLSSVHSPYLSPSLHRFLVLLSSICYDLSPRIECVIRGRVTWFRHGKWLINAWMWSWTWGSCRNTVDKDGCAHRWRR